MSSRPPKSSPGLGKRPVRADLIEAAALEVYASVRHEGRLADRALDRVLRREKRLYSSERRAIAEGVWGLLRHERRLDFALFQGKRPDLAGADLDRARWAALAVLEGTPAREVAASMRLPSALLPRLERVAQPLPEGLDPVARVALEGSLPDFVARLLVSERGAEDALAFARALTRRAALSIRANGLKTDREKLAARLQAEGFDATPGRWSPLALTLQTRVNVFALEAFQEGLFEVQDEGSQLLALLVQARPGERVVDACAGAGGKTLALSADMRNKGELLAFDVDGERLSELSRRARRAGAHNVRSRALPEGEAAASELKGLEGKVDRVLVDAPCSGLGALRRNPDSRYRLKPEDFVRYPSLQKGILERFSRLVRPGGRLVYATCSIARAEDEGVVEPFLAANPSFKLMPASTVVDPALCEGPYLRTSPQQHGTDGFFAAVLQRG